MIRAYGQRLTRYGRALPIGARVSLPSIGEPWHPPAVGFSYAFDGTALGPRCSRRCWPAQASNTAVSHYFHDQLREGTNVSLTIRTIDLLSARQRLPALITASSIEAAANSLVTTAITLS